MRKKRGKKSDKEKKCFVKIKKEGIDLDQEDRI